MALSPQAQAELAEMALALAHNPKTRAKFAAVVKEAGLPYQFNDIEAATAAQAATQQLVKDELAADQRAREAQQTTRQMNEARASLIRSDENPDGRFDEKTVKERLEPFMQERGITNYADGAILFANYHPEVLHRPEINTKGTWEMPAGDWLNDPRGTARKMAYAAVGDIIAKRR